MRDKSSDIAVEKVAEELKKARKSQGLSHQTLADMTGISRAGISFIESRKRSPSLQNCLKLAKALGLRLTDILARVEK
jgi:transcriptional regulator with XRE-family HTH domain